MTRLALVVDRNDVPDDADEVFLWDGTPQDSFKSALGPNFADLGPVPPLSGDFARIAVAMHAADHTIPRQARGSNWNRRRLIVSVPVSDPSAWAEVEPAVVEAVNFLTGDDWGLEFTACPPIPTPEHLVGDSSTRVVLLSGGADSGSGALISGSLLHAGGTHTFVSHASSGAARAPQKELRERLEGIYPGKQAAHHRQFIGRSKKRADGTKYPSEPSSRSRSLLFLALGLAVAAQAEVPLWIPENGFASLNPPLGPERIGALSTRTTQPWFLWRIQELLESVGAHGVIENPFQLVTKGEMFTQVKKLLGEEGASAYLSATNSCSHTDQNYQGVPSGTHCGVCFGCILRRASFHASGVKDATTYLSDDTKYARYVASHSSVTAARDFALEPISSATVIMMSLPPTLSARQAMELCQRGQAEIGAYLG